MTRTRALMLQGTGSNVGKSILVAGLCRLFTRRGLRVRPFKPQNMSNNAAVTIEGGEIGRAQALQARACRLPPRVDFNPVLLKPESERGAQVVVRGRRLGTYGAREYHRLKPDLLPAVVETFEAVRADADLVLVEGAGSPAEVNLRAGDIANMGFAEAADVPVALIGDIERGGVIASIVGTVALLEPDERQRLKGYIVNRFRGDPRLFDNAHPILKAQTGLANFGVVPWFDAARKLPAEDVMDLERLDRTAKGDTQRAVIAVPRTPRIANFDDLDPLAAEPAVDLRLVHPGEPLPAEAGIVILPGSKATISDLAAIRAAGWDIDLKGHVRRGGRVLGLCGGYQMLGQTLSDPEGVEGPSGTVEGLGLLNVKTTLTADKTLRQVRATAAHAAVTTEGYEMHLGRTDGPDRQRPVFHVEGAPEGASSSDYRVLGTYLHGALAGDPFRRWLLSTWGIEAAKRDHEQVVDTTLDKLADHLTEHLDVDALLAAAA